MEQKIIIFEGLDMVGKTTIAKEFSKIFDIPYFSQKHDTKWHDPSVDLIYGEEARLQMFEQIGCSAVLDRSYPSEYAYAKAYNRPLLESKIWDVDRRYEKLGAIIVYCYKAKENWMEDKTKLIDMPMYEKIVCAYDDFFAKNRCQTHFLDTTNKDLADQIYKLRFLI